LPPVQVLVPHNLEMVSEMEELVEQALAVAGGALARLAPSSDFWYSTTFWTWVFWVLWSVDTGVADGSTHC